MSTATGTLDSLAPKEDMMGWGGWGSYLGVFVVSAVLAFILLWALNPKIVQKGHNGGHDDRDSVEGGNNGGHGHGHRQPDPAKVLVGALLIALVVVLIFWVCYKCK